MSKLREHVRCLLVGMPAGSVLRLTRESLCEWYSLDDEDKAEPDADSKLTDVAERYGRSTSTIRDWIRQGVLDAYKFRGREWRVTAEALAEFDRNQKHGDLAAWRKVGGTTLSGDERAERTP